MTTKDRRRLGIGLVLVGILAVLIGLVGMLSSGEDGDLSAATTIAAATTATGATTTTAAPTSSSTSTTTTTTVPATSSSTSSTTSTTGVSPQAIVEEFAAAFASSLATGSGDFAYERLHPVVVALYGADLCRAYVDREVVLISDYTFAGPVSGPTPQPFTTATGDVTVDVYTAPVTFTFQGQQFEATGDFALVDGVVHWFTTCR